MSTEGERATHRETIGVVGAGVIGRGVAQSFADAGHRVVLLDVDRSKLDDALSGIRDGLRLQRMMSGNPPARDGVLEVLGRIRAATDYRSLSEADYVVENVVERWPVKAEVYPRLDAVCPEACLIMANTSCIPITRLADLTDRPDRVIGVHFMNPVPMKATVEVIPGRETSPTTVERTRRLLARLGKDCIVVRDHPGFVTNRVLMPMINEASLLVQEAVAPPSDIDALFKECFGHKMGPLETADLIGLDTVVDSLIVLHDSFENPKFEPSQLLRQMVAKGLLGHKVGHGFYDYGISHTSDEENDD